MLVQTFFWVATIELFRLLSDKHFPLDLALALELRDPVTDVVAGRSMGRKPCRPAML